MGDAVIAPAFLAAELARDPGRTADLFAPRRVRLSRARGFDLQETSFAINGLRCVSVSRPGVWGNHAGVRAGVTKGQIAVDIFDLWIRTEASWAWKGAARVQLVGRNLACWCTLCPEHAARGKLFDERCRDCAPCHADVLGRFVCETVETAA